MHVYPGIVTSERVFYADANGVSIGTGQAVFGEHAYATRNITSVSVVSSRRKEWPALVVMVIGWALIGFGFVFSTPGMMLVGGGGVLSGSLYFTRRRATFAVRIVTNKGPMLVLASKRRPYADQIRQAVDRAIEEAHAG